MKTHESIILLLKIRNFASMRETSDAIAVAIFELAVEGDESRMWAAPTEVEATAVIARAFELCGDDTETLYWGDEPLRRGSPMTTIIKDGAD